MPDVVAMDRARYMLPARSTSLFFALLMILMIDHRFDADAEQTNYLQPEDRIGVLIVIFAHARHGMAFYDYRFTSLLSVLSPAVRSEGTPWRQAARGTSIVGGCLFFSWPIPFFYF